MTRNEMREKLQTVLSSKRYVHSVGVMDTAVKLAKKYKVDSEEAAVAGILHDCARDINGDKLFELCEKHGITVDALTLAQPELLHGPLGSKLAMQEYGVTNEKILKAILYHTIGCVDMSMLDKIIFIADYIEPGRNFPGVDAVRVQAFRDIDSAVIMAMDKTINYVISKGTLIHPETVNARNYIKLVQMRQSKTVK